MPKAKIKFHPAYDRFEIQSVLSTGAKIIDIEGPEAEISDGSHTFDELYEHRYQLWITVCSLYAEKVGEIGHHDQPHAWRSHKHFEESFPMFTGYFVLGIGKEKGKMMSYHLPIKCWDQTDFAETLDSAPEWDGHTSQDVLERLKML